VISAVLSDALSVYRRLIRRSIAVAGIVFAVVGLAQALADRHPTPATLLVSLVLGLVGGLLVQGALVEVVRDLHEGRAAGSAGGYYERTRGRLGTLLGATLLYGLGVGLGLVLLIVPGLILMSRWSLVVPLVMIERRGVRESLRRSSELVRGRTGRVLLLMIVAALITGIASALITLVFLFLPAFAAAWLGGLVAGALTVPYQAHVLTVLYYRLTDPERPVLPAPGEERWRSIWDEETEDSPE
jgi:Membrane domain of glycerophosphoryl diester phosphodiesterase